MRAADTGGLTALDSGVSSVSATVLFLCDVVSSAICCCCSTICCLIIVMPSMSCLSIVALSDSAPGPAAAVPLAFSSFPPTCTLVLCVPVTLPARREGRLVGRPSAIGE